MIVSALLVCVCVCVCHFSSLRQDIVPQHYSFAINGAGYQWLMVVVVMMMTRSTESRCNRQILRACLCAQASPITLGFNQINSKSSASLVYAPQSLTKKSSLFNSDLFRKISKKSFLGHKGPFLSQHLWQMFKQEKKDIFLIFSIEISIYQPEKKNLNIWATNQHICLINCQLNENSLYIFMFIYITQTWTYIYIHIYMQTNSLQNNLQLQQSIIALLLINFAA